MLAGASIIGFIPVHDLAEAEAFYSGVLGLTVVDNVGFALVLRAAGGIMVRCIAVPDLTPQPFTVLGWEVADIRGESKRLTAEGIEPLRYGWFKQDEDGVWTAPNGDEVLWFNDPFGNVLSLSHHAG